MTDTRCANPEYQLDVDLMILEYMLYYAIDAKLKALKTEVDEDDTEDGFVSHETADGLIENFDILLQLFKMNHTMAPLDEGTTFNIKILEFLVLFWHWRQKAQATDPLLTERDLNADCRRTWLKERLNSRQGLGFNVDFQVECKEEPFYHTRYIELNDVLLRFMELSAEVSNAAGPVNEQWYKLAAEIMVQSALQRAQNVRDRGLLHDKGDPDQHVLMAYLSECFAWDATCPDQTWIHRSTTITEARINRFLQDQVFISDTFKLRDGSEDAELNPTNDTQMTDADGDGDDGDGETTTEDLFWTNLRTQIHSECLEIVGVCQQLAEDCPCITRFASLQQKYPLDPSLSRLLHFVEGLWCLNMGSLNDKPVLVQIEEGGLKGLDDAGFEQFLDRVGLKMSTSAENGGRRVVRWAR